ncbi:FecR family protein [Bowmanella denitrificans]|uniref:FecR family protein n=1 Tax=Bowmanella denitrificans TaxID=366582 RepID=UPI000C9A24FA|nr:FecR domain-containing protein [Bowmanella denitrificans]
MTEQQKRLDTEAREWLIRLQEAAPDAPLKAQFSRWLNQSDAHKQAFSRIDRLWRQLGLLDNLEALTANQPAAKPLKQPGVALATWLGMAAALLIVVLGWQRLPFSAPVTVAQVQHFATPAKMNTTLTLEDGSQVISAGSARFSYLQDTQQRLLQMHQGTLYFDVAHNAELPFVITSGGSRVQVLGTAFEISLTHNQLRLSVQRGRVEMTALDKGKVVQKAQLTAGQQLVADAAGHFLGNVQTFDSRQALSWLQGRLEYDGTPLADVVQELNRYLSQPVEIDADNLNTLLITASGRIDQAEQILQGLLLANDLQLEKRQARLLIKPLE